MIRDIRGGDSCVAQCKLHLSDSALLVGRLVLSGSFDFGWGRPSLCDSSLLASIPTPVSPSHQLHVKAALYARRDPCMITVSHDGNFSEEEKYAKLVLRVVNSIQELSQNK